MKVKDLDKEEYFKYKQLVFQETGIYTLFLILFSILGAVSDFSGNIYKQAFFNIGILAMIVMLVIGLFKNLRHIRNRFNIDKGFDWLK